MTGKTVVVIGAERHVKHQVISDNDAKEKWYSNLSLGN